MATPREHVAEIRREKFSIGGKPNPLTEDLHNSVDILSGELYTKDIHFLMELIQNAEDNDYLDGVNPSLEFIITSEDITATGSSATLLIFNNEKGFFPKNIDSICSVGRSTKKGNRKCGYIGEKGIGFKSVFLITSQPYIFSNGYQIRFSEVPNQDCKIGYIVPEWVDENPTLTDIQQIYGSTKPLPTTTIILPLKSEKVGAVKQQLSSLHPEVLLFLSKIKRLSVKEKNSDLRLNTVSAISITSETDLKSRKNIDAESYTLHLSADGNGDEEQKECRYYMWKQRFPVGSGCKVERRLEIEEWVITLAFPFGERLARNQASSPGVYAFLPTEMVTNLPFIIQADFILASSRETILLDNKWNRGILNCVPSAFVNAFVSLVKTVEEAPLFNLPKYFKFLPVKVSPYAELNMVRNAIRAKVVSEHIVPCESYTQQMIFCKPNEAGRLLQAFWNVLIKAEKQGSSLQNMHSHGTYILSSAFDEAQYDEILDFLGVKFVSNDWYANCIQSSIHVLGVSEDVYMELLCFLADNWSNFHYNTAFAKIPILKYMDQDGKVDAWSINRAKEWRERICVASHPDQTQWLINCSREFRCAADMFFMPEGTQEALRVFFKRETIRSWLRDYAYVEDITVSGYATALAKVLNERKLLIAFTHFLYHSLSSNYLSESEVSKLCTSIPIVNNYGNVTKDRREVLVPAAVSRWVELMGSNPWRGEKIVELAADYICPGNFGHLHTSRNQLLKFMKTHIKALDIPELCPPDAEFPIVASPLTKGNTFLLLDWIRNLKCRGVTLRGNFLRCIREGSWLKTGLGYKPPSESFLPSSGWGNLLQKASVLVDTPLINEQFYDRKISSYEDELKTIGVMSEAKQACQHIAKQLMSLANSSRLTRESVLSMLNFIKFLRENYYPLEQFVNSVKQGKWLKTCHGERSPIGSVLFDSEWEAVSQISSLPFIDEKYYGEEIRNYCPELQLLGVVVGFNQNFQLVAENLKLPMFLTNLSSKSVLLILECLRHSRSTEQLVRILKEQSWIKTNLGFKSPMESFLFDSQWGCLLQIVSGVPLIDEKFYGSSLRSYTNQLKQIGVVISFEEASKAIAHRFKQLASSNAVKKENVMSLLECYKHIKEINHPLPTELFICTYEQKWLSTNLGYKSPQDSILFNSEWESISPIACLPFIDDTHYGQSIYTYRDELKALGVVVDFKRGVRFVATCLNLPENPIEIAPSSVISLLECIKILSTEAPSSLPAKKLLESVDKEWLKTHMGYRSPQECLLFDSKWGSFLQREDGPFIDEAFYDNRISSYREELRAMGVVVEPKDGCLLLANHLEYHSQLPVITRIYEYLSKFNWEPEDKSDCWIWIPNGSNEGEWVCPEDCVLRDKDDLFGLQLNVLEKYYDKKLLSFFSSAFGAAHSPTSEDYCKLWKDWEKGQNQLTMEECCSFWGYIAKHCSSRTEKHFTSSMSKLPVNSVLGEIRLCKKQEVFIPDDLLLKDLFEKAFPDSIFVWYPQPSLPSLPLSKLYDIYRIIGVQTISESIRKDESFTCNNVEFQKIEQSDGLIGDGLLRIILGYLANPCFEMPANRRHQIVKSLLDLTVLEMVEPITSSYCLPLFSGKTLSVKVSKMVRWEKNSSKLLVQKYNKTDQRAKIEFATYFSEAISEGLLWENTDQIADLRELIKLGCLLQFEVDAVEFLLKAKNLQLFVEDEEFLSSAFPPDQVEPKSAIE